MDDPTDTALGICAGIGLAICGICALTAAWRNSRIPGRGMKESRSDTDLSMLQDVVTDSLPTHK